MAINPEMMGDLLGRAKARFMADDAMGQALRSGASALGGMAAGSIADTITPGDQGYLKEFGLLGGALSGDIGNYLLERASKKISMNGGINPNVGTQLSLF